MNMKTNKLSLKKELKYLQTLISMKCLECCCFQFKEVLNCNITDCPLWEVRPKEGKGVYTLIKRMKQKKSSNFEANE